MSEKCYEKPKGDEYEYSSQAIFLCPEKKNPFHTKLNIVIIIWALPADSLFNYELRFYKSGYYNKWLSSNLRRGTRLSESW